MGEHQCPHCGHITTGFEEQEFHATRHNLIEECARMAETYVNNSGLAGGPIPDIKKEIAAAIRKLKS